MKFSVLKYCLVFLLAVPALASTVVEDSKSKFILDDQVFDTQVYECMDMEGKSLNLKHSKTFLPEGAVYEQGNAVPFRLYRVALPSNEKPSVTLTQEKFVPLGYPHCSSESVGGDSLHFRGVRVSDPYFKDGLWMADIWVPLFARHGSSVSLRTTFRINVFFSAGTRGVNPGKRAVDNVLNSKGAASFGVSTAKMMKALRKDAANQVADVDFLAQFVVGDRSQATFSEDGLYAVDFKTIRNALLSLQRQDDLYGIPVDEICLYGAAQDTLGDMVPGSKNITPGQIFEIPIEVRDHSFNSSAPDYTFGEGDSIVFVGYGSAFWKRFDREDPSFLNGMMDYFHSYSPYSFYQYFLLGRKEGGKGLRLSSLVEPSKQNAKDVRWMRYVRAEKDALLRDTFFGKMLDWESSTGREWFWVWGEIKDTVKIASSTLNTRETSVLPGFVEGGDHYVAISYFPHRSCYTGYEGQTCSQGFSSQSYVTKMKEIFFRMDVNDSHSVSDKSLDASAGVTTLLPAGNFRMDNAKLFPSGNSYSLTMIPSTNWFDRFDGYSVAYQWTPVVDSAEWLLPGAVSGFINVPVPENALVMKFVNQKQVGFLNASSGYFKDSVGVSDDVRYLAVKKNVFRSALKVQAVPQKNENVISNLERPNSKIEYLIVAPREFISQAVALAEYRSSGENNRAIPSAVVLVDDIYRSYTAGRLSPQAIRNYIAYIRKVCPNLKYVLLAGTGHFDYRGLNSNLTESFIPPFEYEDRNTDDFYATLDSGEVVPYGVYDTDVSIGRLPLTSQKEFNSYLKKVKDYEKSGQMDFSEWRRSLLFSSDDAWNGGFDVSKHTVTVENDVIRTIDKAAAAKGIRWNMKKVYLLDYTEDAAGQKKDAADDFMNIMNQGALFTTYFGHGSETEWASEGLLKANYISRANNEGRNTILGSFSCTVGRYDLGTIRSLSETFIVADGVGSIASVGATRETLGYLNKKLGAGYLMNALVDDYPLLGDALRYAKLSGRGKIDYNDQRANDERYVLLGEPVISVPVLLGDVTLEQKLDTLKALDNVTLSGTVDYIQDGALNLTLSEGRSERKISLQVYDDSLDVFYEGGLIFTEEVPVKNGRFETQFITPRKLAFGDTAAEISIWAFDNKSPNVSTYWRRGLSVSGMSNYADSLNDTIPPSIRIQPCYAGAATDFVSGETVKLQSPACLQVVVEDSSALDFREQADEGISFEVVGVRDAFHPWPYLEQSSKRAKVRMNFAEASYPAGLYVFKVTAYDVVGNRNTKMLNLEITDELKSGLQDVYNAPNPMGRKGTTFYFKDLAFENSFVKSAKVDIFIYNQNGKLVKVLKNAVSGETHWDGCDNHGRLLANGLYHYVVRSQVNNVKDVRTNTFTKKQKLLISR